MQQGTAPGMLAQSIGDGGGLVLNGTAQLAGDLTISHLNGQVIMPGSFRRVIVEAAGGVRDNAMSLTTPPSQAITYTADFARTNSNEAASIYDVDFAPSKGLDRNLTEVGQYLNRVQAAGSSSRSSPLNFTASSRPSSSAAASASSTAMKRTPSPDSRAQPMSHP